MAMVGAVNTDQVPDASHITPPVSLNANTNPITLKVNLAAGFPLAKLESRYHPVEQVTLDDDSRQITLINSTQADRDFELVWQAKASQSPQAALFKQQLNGQEYALLMLNPPSQPSLQESIARELIFVIDTSGSMTALRLSRLVKPCNNGLINCVLKIVSILLDLVMRLKVCLNKRISHAKACRYRA